MSFLDKLSNGWQISMNSFKVLRENKPLILFPILSGVSLVLIVGSFVIITLSGADWEVSNLSRPHTPENYLLLFLFYIINYFIVVYFNTALIHCASLYFNGEKTTVRQGLDFSFSRIGPIFSWAVFAGTIGTLLKILQDSLGNVGKIITSLIGVVWSIATFFVVPVIAYENLGPIGAVKRSTQLMKDKWGERLAAGFSFGIIQMLGIFAIAIPCYLIGAFINPIAGIVIAVLAFALLFAAVSAALAIFISATYHNISGDPVEHYNQQFVDGLFKNK